MLYFGAYKVNDYKNISSIPDVLTHEKTKNNGIVFVVSDTLFTNNNNEVSQDFFASAKSFIEKLGRQVRVHNNVEAIVLNGNMFRNMSSKNNTQIFDSTMWSCSFLRAIYMTAGTVHCGEKPVPIYYVRGNEDCYMSIPNLTSDLRGAIKICNAVIIGDTLFIHGHNNLPFKEQTESDIHANNIESRKLQELEAESIFEQTGFNVVMSNSILDVYAGKHFISTGCFEKTRGTAINLSDFSISMLTHGVG